MAAVFIWTFIGILGPPEGCGAEVGGAYCGWPGTIRGKADEGDGADAAEANGNSPRALRAPRRFSAAGVCDLLVLIGSWGAILAT